jgi:hypothetical protein
MMAPVLGALGLVALAPKPASGQFEAVSAVAACPVVDIAYSFTASLRITETALAAGDGVHSIGPGTLVLRFDRAKARVQLVTFDLKEHFAVSPKAVLWNGTVVTDAEMRATPDGSGAIAAGTFSDGTLRWAGPLHGYRTEGSLVCDGSLCGKFGAPPPGRSDIHSPPTVVHFQPLRFAEGGAAFQMPYALVSQSDSPRQKTYLSISGREANRSCLQAAAAH